MQVPLNDPSPRRRSSHCAGSRAPSRRDLPGRRDAARHDGDRRQCDEHAAALDDRLRKSLGRISFRHQPCRASFAINILHRNQVEISTGCGGKARGEDRFGLRRMGRGRTASRCLTDAQARIVCTKEA